MRYYMLVIGMIFIFVFTATFAGGILSQPYFDKCKAIGGTVVHDHTLQCWDTAKGIRLFPENNR